uniref:Uncharacterized protein n=1 Tax=Chenopodium quinoa TaxID=63459 RepID=A0A803MP89_CHEQI
MELERVEREWLEREELDRLELESVERERLEKKEKERLEGENEQEELDWLEKEKEEFEWLEKEKESLEREKEKEELDRLEKEKEEFERLEKEKGEKEIGEKEEEEETRIMRGPRSPERSDAEISYSYKEEITFESGALSCLFDAGDRSRRKWKTTETPNRLVQGNYVRFAAKIFEKLWGQRFIARSRRFMLDPAFSHLVLNMKSPEDLDRTTTSMYTRHIFGLSPNRINVVFVPVVLSNNWWFVPFSLNREEILVMDSMETTTATDLHSINVQKLDPNINVERSWLLFEDLIYDFNNARPVVLDAVTKKATT